ncbi:MAG: ISL3 family transposase, partial [Armatimonadota bacterium]
NAGLYREIVVAPQAARCPDCGRQTSVVHEYHPKCVTSGTYNGAPVYDTFVHRRLACGCGRTFMEPLPWLPRYQRMSTDAERVMCLSVSDGTFQSVGQAFGRTGQNVRTHVVAKADVQEDLPLRPTPAYLGMDEITLVKGKGQYRLVVYDMTVPWRPESFTMLPSRRLQDVVSFIRQLPHPERIIAVAIDMWEPYRRAVQCSLPGALVVVDAFHLIQASTRALDEVRKKTQKDLDPKQSLALKQEKELFTTPMENLSPEKLARLEYWKTQVPELALAFSLHHRLRGLYRCSSFEDALDHLALWEREVLQSGLESFLKLHSTVWNWLPEIMNRFICKISNAKTEGKNN